MAEVTHQPLYHRNDVVHFVVDRHEECHAVTW
jgi:hypothetical protein